MTHPPNDPPPMWFKQVPKDAPAAPGTWCRRLIPGHLTVQRSHELPADLEGAQVIE